MFPLALEPFYNFQYYWHSSDHTTDGSNKCVVLNPPKENHFLSPLCLSPSQMA